MAWVAGTTNFELMADLVSDAVAELKRRGIDVSQTTPVDDQSAPEAPSPDEIPAAATAPNTPPSADDIAAPNASGPADDNSSPREMERALRVKQLHGALNVQDAVNELARRGVQTKLTTQPFEAQTSVSGAKLQAIDANLLAQSHSSNPHERLSALREISNRALEQQHAQTFGDAPPDTLPGEGGAILKHGTPEYYSKLQEGVIRRQNQLAVAAAHIKAIPEVEKVQAEAAAKLPLTVADHAKGLRNEIENDPVLKPVQEAQGYLATAKTALQKPNPTNADDQLLTEALIKLTDPAGVIRQSKVEYLEAMTPVYQRALKSAQHLYSNQNTVLSPGDRQQIAGAITQLEQGYAKAAQPRLRMYSDEANRLGVGPDRILDPRLSSILGGATSSYGGPASSLTPGSSASADAPVRVNSPAEAPETARFIQSPDGRVFRNPKFKK